MIYLIHNHIKPLKILNAQFEDVEFNLKNTIQETLFELAKEFPTELLIWCHKAYHEYINTAALNSIFHHQYILASYSVSGKHFFRNDLGYVDQSVFLKVNKAVTYPTWFMSSDVGGVSAQLINLISGQLKVENNFSYFLNVLAKEAMPKGLFCYSEPKLLKERPSHVVEIQQASKYDMFKFVKQHYKWVWVWMLAFCYLIYEKKVVLLPLWRSFFYKRLSIKFEVSNVKSTKQLDAKRDVDVIIPTIGRKTYLYDVLKDLANQTLLPKNVIIIEQNPLPDSVSELDYLKTETWPFTIKHTFTHQTGVCNARNLALQEVTSNWVFLNDDDNRFNERLIELALEQAEQFGVEVITTAYLQNGEQLLFNTIHQTGIFGSGNSFVKASCLKQIRFDKALEFGYGEDFDFGMQLRNKGYDVVYFSNIKITHLKAPLGGFRTKIKQLWDDDVIQPKPSPTIMYTFLKHRTKQQISSYKLILFLRLLKKASVLGCWKFYKTFQKQWQASLYWAEKL